MQTTSATDMHPDVCELIVSLLARTACDDVFHGNGFTIYRLHRHLIGRRTDKTVFLSESYSDISDAERAFAIILVANSDDTKEPQPNDYN